MFDTLSSMSEEILYVVANCFNPEGSEIRYKLHRDFKKYLAQFTNIVLIEVELAIGDQPFRVTETGNKYQLQFRTNEILWFKENLNNIAFRHIRTLIGPTVSAKVAWIDGDVSFSNKNWVRDTLRMLEVFRFVQLFETCDSLGPENEVLRSDPGFVYKWLHYGTDRAQPGRTGLAWAGRLEVLEQLNYLPDWDILGASDLSAAYALTGQIRHSKSPVNKKNLEWTDKASRIVNASVSCVPGILVHYFHGWPSDRGYGTRGHILIDHDFNFDRDMNYRPDGLLQFNPLSAKPALMQDIKGYFKSRREHGRLEDETLYLVTCVFSPSRYKSRYNTYARFAEYVSQFKNAKLYTIEVAIGDQDFQITDPHNPQHLQIRTDRPLWYKENIQNIMIKQLPEDAKKIALVDCDLIWEGDDWVDRTLQALDVHPVVQMFSTWQNLDENDIPTSPPVDGFAQRYVNKTQVPGANGFTGLAWAWRRKELEAVGGLIDFGILGSGDYFMANGLIGKNRSDAGHIDVVKEPDLVHFVQHLDEALDPWIERANEAVKHNIGYVDLNVLHCFHGKKTERGYDWRWRILAKHNYRPLKHLSYDHRGLLQLTNMPEEFFQDVQGYFDSRNEDYGLKQEALQLA